MKTQNMGDEVVEGKTGEMRETMKHFCSFSEAMRAGISIRSEQCFGRMYRRENASCALGAALEAILERPATRDDFDDAEFVQAFRDQYNAQLDREIVPPCGCKDVVDGCVDLRTGAPMVVPRVDNVIAHLNNHHKWTRERIADWLEAEEEKLGFVTLYESESESESSSPVDTQVVSV